LMDDLRSKDNVILALAFADWRQYERDVATKLSKAGFDLIYVPDKNENASDYKLAAYVLSHFIRYDSTTDTVVIVSGDVDFEIMVGALEQCDKDVWIIGKPLNTAERLTEIANFIDVESYRTSAMLFYFT